MSKTLQGLSSDDIDCLAARRITRQALAEALRRCATDLRVEGACPREVLLINVAEELNCMLFDAAETVLILRQK